MSKFYITTAIAYASRKPHIGNTYDVVLADMIARYKRMQGFDVHFLTGSDEHGQKIEEYAKEAGITPKEYVDNIAGEIKAVWDSLDLTYDRFIRTTDKDHEDAVSKIFKKLYEQGDIYKDVYEGKYCVPCESFFTESQLVDGKCPDCGREVKDAKEEAYFLRLSKYQDRLLKYFEENPDFLKPDSRRNEMINNFLKPGLSDLCVSRSSFKWGIPVTFDDKHIVYVWIDALSNYISALGYLSQDDSKFKRYWPADLHIVGKEIVRFHTIIWPIMLMALGLELPKKVFGHGWLVIDGGKISKSSGNYQDPREYIAMYGIDAVRYFVLREVPFGNDGNFSVDAMVTRANADLANVLGNLVNRTIGMINKYFDGVVTNTRCNEELDNDLIKVALSLRDKVDKDMDKLEVSSALEHIFDLFRACNKYIDETMPWILAKEENKKDRLATVLYNLVESIRIGTVFLSPFIPSASERIFKQLNTDIKDMFSVNEFGGYVSGAKVGIADPIFQRIEVK